MQKRPFLQRRSSPNKIINKNTSGAAAAAADTSNAATTGKSKAKVSIFFFVFYSSYLFYSANKTTKVFYVNNEKVLWGKSSKRAQHITSCWGSKLKKTLQVPKRWLPHSMKMYALEVYKYTSHGICTPHFGNGVCNGILILLLWTPLRNGSSTYRGALNWKSAT